MMLFVIDYGTSVFDGSVFIYDEIRFLNAAALVKRAAGKYNFLTIG